MSLLQIFVLALALSADGFSVAAVVGLRHRTLRQLFRLPFHFGVFQALMVGIGALAAHFSFGFIAGWGHWLVWGLLVAIGVKMIYESFGKKGYGEDLSKDLTRGLVLIGLSVAISLDALAAGLSLVITEADLLIAILLIGIVSWIMPTIGMILARVVERWIGRKCELIAGVILIGLGFKTLFFNFI